MVDASATRLSRLVPEGAANGLQTANSDTVLAHLIDLSRSRGCNETSNMEGFEKTRHAAGVSDDLRTGLPYAFQLRVEDTAALAAFQR